MDVVSSVGRCVGVRGYDNVTPILLNQANGDRILGRAKKLKALLSSAGRTFLYFDTLQHRRAREPRGKPNTVSVFDFLISYTDVWKFSLPRAGDPDRKTRDFTVTIF